MARLVHLRVELDPTRDHPLTGAVLLRVRGIVVLDWCPAGLGGSALALARAAEGEHAARSDDPSAPCAEWPLFFGAVSPDHAAGAVADFSVAHAGDTLTLSEFSGCVVPRATRFEVPWSAFAAAVIRLGDLVVRRSRHDAWREELRVRLRPIRRRRRLLVRAETPRA